MTENYRFKQHYCVSSYSLKRPRTGYYMFYQENMSVYSVRFVDCGAIG
jgi:hypothetical protein